jgi:hypothetical protein
MTAAIARLSRFAGSSGTKSDKIGLEKRIVPGALCTIISQ